jgi:predicted DCC family thiol-disulfide oxidoreductase YuxK
MLIPYAAELFSSSGVLPTANLNKTYPFFPNILYLFDGPIFVTSMVSLLAVLSLCLTVGLKRKIVALVLWYGHVALFNRNNFIANPGLPFVGWLLLACAVIPYGEPLAFESKKNQDEDWSMPPALFWGAWIFTSVGYSISGFHKYSSVSWYDGTALIHLLNNPLAREHFLRTFFESQPVAVLKGLCWFLLASEILYAPLALWRKTRAIAFFSMVAMHIGILAIVDFADLTVGVLMIHLFTFDGRWIKSKNKNGIVFFDGVCGLCNKFVDFAMLEDRDRVLRFAPLEGETAKEHEEKIKALNSDSVVLIDETGIYHRSDAVIRICQQMGNIWGLAVVLKIIPRPLRDACYKVVAQNRYALWGKKDSCRLPTAEERGRLLL